MEESFFLDSALLPELKSMCYEHLNLENFESLWIRSHNSYANPFFVRNQFTKYTIAVKHDPRKT